MHHRILADAVVFVHLAFILFVAVGALLAWRWPRMAWLHLPALAWAVGSVTIGFPCPLTGLEKALRRRSDGHGYEGGFVDQYLENVIYPEEHSTSLRALVAVLILIGYYGCLRRRRRRTPSTRSGAWRPPGLRDQSPAQLAATGATSRRATARSEATTTLAAAPPPGATTGGPSRARPG